MSKQLVKFKEDHIEGNVFYEKDGFYDIEMSLCHRLVSKNIAFPALMLDKDGEIVTNYKYY